MNKIIIVHHEPLTHKLRELFYIDAYLQGGYEVEYWNCSEYFHPGFELVDSIAASYSYNIRSVQELQRELERVKDTKCLYIADQDFESWQFRRFFLMMGRYRCYMVSIDVYANAAIIPSRIQRWNRIWEGSILIKIQKAISNRCYQSYKRYMGYTTFERHFTSAARRPHTDLINHPDHQCYLQLHQESKTAPSKGAYILFLDIYFPLHPDLALHNPNTTLDPATYYERMNALFGHLERRYNMPVVIAAHPKSTYTGEFGNRKIIKYQTGELVASASFVITHLSNSTSYAILEDKPIIFVATDQMKMLSKFYFKVKSLAGICGKKVYNLDHCQLEQIEFSTIEPPKRESYIYSYLTSPDTEKLTNEEILLKAWSHFFAQ